jgi:S1-C subfamily serine protease
LLAGQSAGYVLALTPTGLDIWQPDKVTVFDHVDLVVMTLRRASALPPDNTLRHVVISTRVPEIGAPVMITGFRAGSPAFTLSPPMFSGEVRAATGVVTAHYPSGRDQFMMPWPCIEVSADTAGGMSGGPAFDAEGHLIGVLSSGMTSADGGGPSYVSVIHPALDQQFQVPLLNKQSSLRDLATQMGSIAKGAAPI